MKTWKRARRRRKKTLIGHLYTRRRKGQDGKRKEKMGENRTNKRGENMKNKDMEERKEKRREKTMK